MKIVNTQETLNIPGRLLRTDRFHHIGEMESYLQHIVRTKRMADIERFHKGVKSKLCRPPVVEENMLVSHTRRSKFRDALRGWLSAV